MRRIELRRTATRLLPLSLALLVSVASVSSVGAAQEATKPPKQQKKRTDTRVITRADLDEAVATVTTAHDAVTRLRPQWLTPPRGRISGASGLDAFSSANPDASEPRIYIDDMLQTGMDALRALPARNIVEMKYLDQNRAIQLLGPGNEAGAIQVTTDRRRP